MDRKMEIIQQLMEELQEMMQPSGDDLGSRLGREPEMKLEIEAEGVEPMDGEEFAMEGEDEMEMEGPEEKLKSRLMKLRG